jgi:DNA-directed RNA polymerase specialized sigma24 family protein
LAPLANCKLPTSLPSNESRIAVDAPLRGSVTTWLDALKSQQESAAQELWNRYFAMLVAVARRHLRGLRRDTDEEDIALSALKSAMLGVQNNRFPELVDRTGLWPLLVTITARKAANEIQRQRAKKRDRSVEQPIVDAQQILGDDPSPDFAIQLAETIQHLVRSLGDDTLQTIAQRKLEGYANAEIANELDVSTRTVVRKLARIRQEWDEREDHN